MQAPPTVPDPDRTNPQTFCLNCTMRPTAQSRNLIISLISELEYFYTATDFFLPQPPVFIFRGTKTLLSLQRLPDITSLDFCLATDLPLTLIRRAVLHH